jgi:hypothetical protein
MKFLAILFFIIYINSGFSQIIPSDKQKHIAAGFILGGLPTMNKNIKHPFWTSVAVATSAGIAKEYYDSRVGGVVEAKDIYATIAGGALSGSIAYLVKKRKRIKTK